MKRLLPVLVLTLLGLGWTSLAHAQTTLRYKFKKGEKLEYVLDQKMKVTQEVLGMNIETSMDQHMAMSWKVESVDDKGAAKIAMTFGRMKMALDTPMGKFEVDSDSKEEPDNILGKTLHTVVASLAGMELSFTMDPTGELREVTIPEKSAEKLKNLAGPGLGDMFSEDSLKKMATQGLVFPAEAIAKGKSWKHKSSMKMPFGKMVMDNDYTYEGSEEKGGVTLEKISLKPSMKMEPDPDAKVALKLKSSQGKATFGFDNKAGRFSHVNMHQIIVMELEVNNMTISQTIDTTGVMKLKTSK